MKDMILLILGLALADLYALNGFLSSAPLLGQDKPGRKLLALGLAVAVVTLLDSLLLALLRPGTRSNVMRHYRVRGDLPDGIRSGPLLSDPLGRHCL